MEEGCAVDFVDGCLYLVIKDDTWNEAQLAAASQPFEVSVCETNGMIVFLLEGGPLDTSDFYFNIQECDDKEALLNARNLEVRVVLLDENNTIALIRGATLSQQTTEKIVDLLRKQNAVQFMPGEYDVNVSGMQDAYEPAELAKFAKCTFEIK